VAGCYSIHRNMMSVVVGCHRRGMLSVAASCRAVCRHGKMKVQALEVKNLIADEGDGGGLMPCQVDR
jgi:hypothetical protein